MHDTLVASADIRDRPNIILVVINVVPSDEDGKDCLMRPKNFQLAMAYRLGMNVLNEEIPCPLCKQLINKYGDHATCCTKSGDLIIRHNSMRNLIEDIASDGMLSPVLEKEGILGNTTGRHPGDVTIQRWAEGKWMLQLQVRLRTLRMVCCYAKARQV